MSNRKFLPTLGELVDRLSIFQLKELLIPEHKKEYAQSIQDILHDLDLIINEENVKIDAKTIRNILLLAIYNREIWLNEANCRNGIKDGNNLFKSHGINSLRNNCVNRIQDLTGGRKDYKLDNVEAVSDWIPSW